MAKLIKRYEVKLTEQQSNTLEKLRLYNIVPSKFIRLAIKEKLELKKMKDLYPNIYN